MKTTEITMWRHKYNIDHHNKNQWATYKSSAFQIWEDDIRNSLPYWSRRSHDGRETMVLTIWRKSPLINLTEVQMTITRPNWATPTKHLLAQHGKLATFMSAAGTTGRKKKSILWIAEVGIWWLAGQASVSIQWLQEKERSCGTTAPEGRRDTSVRNRS